MKMALQLYTKEKMPLQIVTEWGLLVPGRSPTPSEGRAQVYSRVGPSSQQRIKAFDNGTTLQFGPLDLVDEIRDGDPFFEQVRAIDNAVHNITLVSARHDGEDPENERAFINFRGDYLPVQQLARVYMNGHHYYQCPSKYASINTTLSVYSHSYGQPKKGAAHPADVDTRFGILTRPDPVQLATSHAKDAKQRKDSQTHGRDTAGLRGEVVLRNSMQPTRAASHGRHHGNTGIGGHSAGHNRGGRRGGALGPRGPHHVVGQKMQAYHNQQTPGLLPAVPHQQHAEMNMQMVLHHHHQQQQQQPHLPAFHGGMYTPVSFLFDSLLVATSSTNASNEYI
ncbi:hypothetical protein BJ878DRAFT_52260 [Calycina marina]|uniref:Uncharacterized protein n=1 Tax=Calycina marina TaxID=1763456 RepID=A0A9P7Z390_9HELO|nr:hypothetical protein BJ878DRAFT_52260 [Calycina marina]